MPAGVRGDAAERGNDVRVKKDQDVVCDGTSPSVPGPGEPESPVLEPDEPNEPEVERTVRGRQR